MGDVVQISEVGRRPRWRTPRPIGAEPATIAFFTGVRIERWVEGATAPVVASPEAGPRTPPRRRRRK